jgi:outer membrane protein TolC
LEKQPALTAARANLAGAQATVSYINSLHIPTFLRPDLPIRRCQAALVLEITQAALGRAEHEATYAVTRNYLAMLYARRQVDIVDRQLADLRRRRTEAADLVKKGDRKDITERTITQIELSIEVALSTRINAAEGIERARAALREAMGVGLDFCLEVVDEPLADTATEACREEVVEAALAHRGEVVLATRAAEAVALEVNAQSCRRGFKTSTFAAGADLHAEPLPQAVLDIDYRPGAVALEMPGTLVGSRCFRVERAQLYSMRADAAAEKVRNLVILDAEEAFLRWEEASRKRAYLLRAAQLAEQIGTNSWVETMKPENAKQPRRTSYEDALSATTLATQIRLQYLEALYRYNLALANLERATAGAACTHPR